MKIGAALIALLSSAASGADAFGVPSTRAFATRSAAARSSLGMSTAEKADDKTEEKEEAKGKKAGKDAPPTHIGWNSHQPVVSFCPY